MPLIALIALTTPAPAPAAPVSASVATPAETTNVVRHSRSLYGTVVEIVTSVPKVNGEAAGNDAVYDAAFDEVRRVEKLVDESDPSSLVAKLNAAAGKAAVVVDPEVYAILAELVRLSKLTKGAFDVTAAVYDDAWHFDAAAAPTRDPLGADVAPAAKPSTGIPDKSAIDKARALVGFDDLVLDAAARTAKLKTPGAHIGVHAVARGYALERAAAVLEEKGLHDFIVSASGDLVVRGDKGGRPWMVGIQDPRAAGHFAAIPSESGAVMTTADYEEFFFDGGVRFHSVLDPRTGQPATRCRSVTVVAKDALTAEAISRGVFVLGAKDGMALVDRLQTVQAVIVTSENKVIVSKGLKDVIQQRPPTDGP
ncbi:MAG TPA: FAD:protein FMN transferase [Myxococcota bacterium]